METLKTIRSIVLSALVVILYWPIWLVLRVIFFIPTFIMNIVIANQMKKEQKQLCEKFLDIDTYNMSYNDWYKKAADLSESAVSSIGYSMCAFYMELTNCDYEKDSVFRVTAEAQIRIFIKILEEIWNW